MSKNYRVGIVGGGVSGLSSALHLAKQHRNLDITIISDKELNETTSFGPPGLFRPSVDDATGVVRQWSRDSYDYFTEMAKSADAPMMGIQSISGYVLSDNLSWLKGQERDYGDIVTSFRWMQESEMDIFTVPYKHGFFYTTVTSQSHFYVPWIAQQALLHGCKFAKQKIGSLAELSDRFDLIVNCTGLSARRLVPDETVVPVRGITVKVYAPWIKHFLLCDDGATFIIPGIDSVFLGTVRQENNWKQGVHISERQAILKRCREVMPSLQRASFIEEWSGLRPFRPIPRLETEILKSKSGSSLTVIHNYGHGGNGITLSWGCAKHVDRLLVEQLRMKPKL